MLQVLEARWGVVDRAQSFEDLALVQPGREAEPMDMTMPDCFRRRRRTARSESADARLTRGGHR
jgi:hypothetical protein